MISEADRVNSRALKLADVHNHPDNRQIAVDQAGVSDIQFPTTVLDRVDSGFRRRQGGF